MYGWHTGADRTVHIPSTRHQLAYTVRWPVVLTAVWRVIRSYGTAVWARNSPCFTNIEVLISGCKLARRKYIVSRRLRKLASHPWHRWGLERTAQIIFWSCRLLSALLTRLPKRIPTFTIADATSSNEWELGVMLLFVAFFFLSNHIIIEASVNRYDWILSHLAPMPSSSYKVKKISGFSNVCQLTYLQSCKVDGMWHAASTACLCIKPVTISSVVSEEARQKRETHHSGCFASCK
jgi:hypothetical protein